MIIFWILLIVLLYFLYQNYDTSSKKTKPDSEAKELLKKRYALGEIDTETYLKMKELL